jgi:hypothetical protein
MSKAIERIVKFVCISLRKNAPNAAAMSIGHILRGTSNNMDAKNALPSQSGHSACGPIISIPASFAAQ